MRRGLCLLVAVGLVAGGALSAPATAAKTCRKAKPSGLNGDTPALKVTDKHTEAKPLATTIEVAPGLALFGDEATYTHGYLDIQVDSKARAAGLWVSLAVPPMRDYDLYLLSRNHVVADSNGWNPGHILPVYDEVVGDQSDGGGDSEFGSETITGVFSPDCAAFTIDAAVALGEGGALPVTVWLGPFGP